MKIKEAFQSFYSLTRLDYSLFSGTGVFLSGLLAGDLYGLQLEYMVAFLVVFFAAIGSFAFNDYCDFDVDKRNSRLDRPLVSGLISRNFALGIGVASFLLVIILSLFLNLLAMLLVLLSLPLFFLYSLGLKKTFFVKNLLIAYAYVATIFLGSIVSDASLEILIVYFAIMGFIVGLAFEIMLDELRDYRFYAEDMVHPNNLAIDYIWEKFKNVWVSEKAENAMKAVEEIQRGLSHRPFNEESEQHQRFLKSLNDKISVLNKEFPFMKFKS